MNVNVFPYVQPSLSKVCLDVPQLYVYYNNFRGGYLFDKIHMKLQNQVLQSHYCTLHISHLVATLSTAALTSLLSIIHLPIIIVEQSLLL